MAPDSQSDDFLTIDHHPGSRAREGNHKYSFFKTNQLSFERHAFNHVTPVLMFSIQSRSGNVPGSVTGCETQTAESTGGRLHLQADNYCYFCISFLVFLKHFR